ncbi:MAG: HEAT repeat domain-containing protein, partial [Planctomycetia bacterium]
KTANPEPLLRHLLAGPWRDEREGWLLFFERNADGIRFRAEEMTRWDRPTAEGNVAGGLVDIALPLVRVHGTIFRFDERTQNLIDPQDLGHRLVPGARPRLPVIDGEALVGDEALSKALKHEDALVRREAAYHAVRGIQRMEIGPDVKPWSLIHDADPECAATGAFAAGACGRSELVGTLSSLLAHRSALVRRECVRSLGLLGWTAQQAELMRLAKEDLDPIVRQLASSPPSPPPRPPQEESGNDNEAGGDEPR